MNPFDGEANKKAPPTIEGRFHGARIMYKMILPSNDTQYKPPLPLLVWTAKHRHHIPNRFRTQWSVDRFLTVIRVRNEFSLDDCWETLNAYAALRVRRLDTGETLATVGREARCLAQLISTGTPGSHRWKDQRRAGRTMYFACATVDCLSRLSRNLQAVPIVAIMPDTVSIFPVVVLEQVFTA